jgi:uncharacterized membrane protein
VRENVEKDSHLAGEQIKWKKYISCENYNGEGKRSMVTINMIYEAMTTTGKGNVLPEVFHFVDFEKSVIVRG